MKPRLSLEARILVAEDNVVNQTLLVRLLQKAGCRADVAANGLEAMEALKRLPFDLVLMDCQMPEMDGFDATRAIRDYERQVNGGGIVPDPNSSYATSGSRGGRIPIVALTANAMKGDRQRCLDAGMDAYFAKPIRLEVLREVIERFAFPVARGEMGAIEAELSSPEPAVRIPSRDIHVADAEMRETPAAGS